MPPDSAGALFRQAGAWAARHWPVGAIVVLWLIGAALVRPGGDVLVNDDFAYVRALEALLCDGRLAATGWGPGGPALLVHLLWGALFAALFGWSLTTLQLSVVVAGLLGLLALFALLRDLGVSPLRAAAGAFTLAANPLFFSQSFSFMTDVTFTSSLLLALYALQRAVTRRSQALLIFGLLLSLAAILVRQTGLVLPVALVILAWRHPRVRELGRWRVTIATVLLNLLPWLVWERVLTASGSTPLTSHPGVGYLALSIANKGWLDTGGLALFNLVVVCLGYTAFFVSPVLLLRRWSAPGRLAFALLGGALLFEGGLISGLISLPVVFHRNVLIDLGIGPLLFKDTYLLGIRRLDGLPPALYGLCLLWAAGGVLVLLPRAFNALRGAWRGEGPFVSHLAWLSAAACVVIFPLTGFHDRYLIPVFALALVALLSEPVTRPPLVASLLSGTLLAMLAAFSVTGTHDFLATRRAAQLAHDYLRVERHCPPCEMDAGFELNGYSCRDRRFVAQPGLSWWWVRRESFLLTLGPLPGYRTERTFPIQRWLGRDGAIHVLAPLKDRQGPESVDQSGEIQR